MVPQSCDTMVALGSATHHGQTLFAKNSDRPADECQPLELHPRKTHPPDAQTQCQFVTLPQSETTYRHIGSRPYWCWGYEQGFNEHQVVIGNEALHSHLPTAQSPKLIGMELLRLGLERSKTASQAVTVMTDLISQYGQGKFENDANVRTYDNGYIVADPHEAYVIETAGHDWAVKKVDQALGISNVYSVETDWADLSPGAKEKASQNQRLNFADTYTKESRLKGSGADRRARSCAVLSHRAGQITPQTMISLLSDHGTPKTDASIFHTDLVQGGICVHHNNDGTGGNTAASLVADLCADDSRLPVYWCNFYSPCLGIFLPTFIEGQLPSVLGIGSEKPDEQSPWWRFHRLSHVVRAYPEDRIPLLQNQWRKLQTQLFDTAYTIATQARQLLDNKEREKATQLLTNYMNQNSTTMLNTLDELLKTFDRQAA